MTADNSAGATLVNIFSVEPENQQALLAMLRENTETVIRTLKGWIDTTLVASDDGKQVVIFSHWETAHDVDSMRADPRMHAYFPGIRALASLDSIIGSAVVTHRR